MSKNFERKVIWVLFILLVIIGLKGCAGTKVPVNVKSEQQVEKDVPTIANMEAIANALGCVFAPETCNKKVTPPESN